LWRVSGEEVLLESAKKYTFGESLGSGTFGDVCVVQYAGHSFAAKRFKVNKHCIAEAVLAEAARHPAFVVLRDAFASKSADKTKTGLWLVYDLAGKTLRQVLETPGPRSPDLARAVVRTLASGLAHLHGKGLIHGDLKPENLYEETVGDGKVYRIGDVGSAVEVLTIATFRSQPAAQ
jgi:serine/threonine protein kinase